MKTDWLNQYILEVLGWTLAHSLWQLLLVAGILWLLFRIEAFKSPQRRYSLGLSALFVILCLFTGTFIYEYELNNLPIDQEIVVPVNALASEKLAVNALSFPEILSRKIEGALPYMVYFWLTGVMVYFFRHAGNFVALQQLKARAEEKVPQPLIQSANKIKQQFAIQFPVDFKLSREIRVPITYGILKPVILIPIGLMVQLSPAQLEAIIAHELAHIRRHDFAINLVQAALEILFFYHPAFWWINTLVKEAREHVADDMAIASGVKSIDLAHALAMVANQATEQSPELAMAAHSSKFPLLNRIKRMLGKEPARFSYSPLITKTMLLTLIFSAILLIGNANEDQASKERWLSTALETEFELSSQYLFDTLQKPVQVARPQVIVEEEVEIIASPEPVENVHEEEITRTFNKSNKTTMVMDSLPNPPVLNLTAAPVLDFQHGFSDSSRVVNITSILSEFGDSIQFFARNIAVFQGDTSVLSQSQREKLNAKIEVLQLKMANSQKVLEQKMKEWEKEFQPKMEEFERKMEAWQKENEPRLKEFEEKMELWAKEQAEKLKLLEKEQELKEKENKEK
ncbi:M56 family metallopeptidase [Cyclobacterium amurskyense]|uniref:TonB domain/peptidase M56 domain protein n=1 Tax=Cyclobacterium amurskyense TaxID=320787 RepID=A0A0H4PC91_9BACT|nr:M56 family metallopeptidase [Cyclobacterium amurskyense]AKP50750.1 TonB domain/peptidase M56 domain protein [Cyclobacterium amurskyense]